MQDLFGLVHDKPSGIDIYVPDSRLSPSARFILQGRELQPDGSTAIRIPPGYVKGPSLTGDGIVYHNPTADLSGKRNTIRVMPPGADPRYPLGYVRVYNSEGQAISPYSGRTGTEPETHYHFGGIVGGPPL